MPIPVKQKLSGNANFWAVEAREQSMTASPASFENPVSYTGGPQAKNVLPQHAPVSSARR
jgi:hypothetical protein